MRGIKNGHFRIPTGYLRQRLSPRNIQELKATGALDDELWILLDYYSEVEEAGMRFLKSKGINNLNTRKKAYKHFQSHVRQAKNYYYSAKSLHPRSASLLYYYSFLNLAKAVLVIDDPSISGKKDFHGIDPVTTNNRIFPYQCIRIKSDGVFPKLYEWYFDQKINNTSLNITSLFRYCSDISYQSMVSAIGGTAIRNCVAAILTDEQRKKGWSLVGIPKGNELYPCKKSISKFLDDYEKIDLSAGLGNEIFKVDALTLGGFDFFQSIREHDWITGNSPPAFNIRRDVLESLKNVFQVNYFGADYDFSVASPYSVRRQIRLDETVAIYLIMFYLSSLVRYKPQYLEKLLSKKESWLIDSFVRTCPQTFLRSMVSRIIGTDFVMEAR